MSTTSTVYLYKYGNKSGVKKQQYDVNDISIFASRKLAKSGSGFEMWSVNENDDAYFLQCIRAYKVQCIEEHMVKLELLRQDLADFDNRVQQQ